MRFACWITKATDTHSERVILIALPLKQWLQYSASMVRERGREQEDLANYTTKSVIFCTCHQLLFWCSSQGRWDRLGM
jgi:hypothetical protein